MKVVGIIPARFSSSRFPGKPLKPILGKPMIVRVYERALKAECWNSLVVATDDERIKKVVEDSGGIALMTSGDHPSGTDRVAETCEILNLDEDDFVVNIQGDEPMLPYHAIRLLVEVFKNSTRASMGTLVYKSSDEAEYMNKNVVKVVIDKDGYALYFSRSPIPFVRDRRSDRLPFLKHLGIYIYTVKFLERFRRLPRGHLEDLEQLEQLRVLENGYKIKVIISNEDSMGVDTPEDLARVEEILRQGQP